LLTAEAIETFCRRHRWFWFCWLSYLPFGFLVVALAFFVGLPQSLGVLCLAIWFVAAAVATWGVVTARCPQCDNRFYRYRNRWYLTPPFFFLYRQCRHCGFSIPAKG
jgi:hypothetical protein